MTFLSALRHALPTFAPGSTRAAATPPVTPPCSPDTPSDTSPATAPRRSRVLRIGALTTTLLLVAGGAFAVANAHKTVTLDVDGEVSQVSSFAGLLDEQGVETGERDIVAPGSDAALRGGDDVVVRHAHPVTVLVDGEGTTVWTTALNADEALTAFASRGDDVSLVASRSGGNRADLSFRLAAGPVDVVVDGRTEHADGRVHVVRLDDRLTAVVQRVEVREEATTSAVPFETATQAAADLYRGQQRTVVAGVAGVRTTTSRVVLVDGVVESSRVVDDAVTTAPVTAVVAEGTRARPASSGGAVVTGDVWGALAQCESGGNPAAVSSNGLYYGLYQFSLGTWGAMGGSGLPSNASPAEQLQRAQALQARSGWGQWPAGAADALAVTELPGPPTALVANLPYNVAVPVLLTFLARFDSLERVLVMVQSEVADRLAAPPGSRTYGVPSAKAAWYADVRRAGSVGRAVFWPVPRVDSALVALQRRNPPATTADREQVFAVVDAAFAQRRKTLRAALAVLAGSADAAERALLAADVDPSTRGERLGVADFARVAEHIDWANAGPRLR